MKRDFTHDDFEDFLKRSADGLRMKAPDEVWQNLSKELNKPRRRLVAGLGLFLLLTTAAGYFIITNTVQEEHTSKQLEPPASSDSRSTNEVNPGTTRNSGSVPVTPSVNGEANASELSATTGRTVSAFSRRNSARASSAASDSRQLPSSERPNPQLEGSLPETKFTPTVVDSYTEFDTPVAAAKPASKAGQGNLQDRFPLSIESLTNAFRARNKKSKFETQLYFTPTISYRKLTENKSYLRSLDPAVALPSSYPGLYTSVNNNVTHKPDLGFELGFATKYALSNRVKLRTGVQFNVNRYEIKAFNSNLSQATIALNTGSSRPDSLNTYSRYSNVGGYKSDWLRNLSFQLSIPVGVEYVFAGTDKLKFGVGGSIQPTYVLGDRAYLITTDYKNYTQVPWLIRRWNVNTALETFITYQGAKRTWQISPQVRYQLLSSFVSEYPVKENLFDFGLKVGISLNK